MFKQMGIGCTTAALLFVVNAETNLAQAQNPRPSSVRTRPVISPYFELLRDDTGLGGVPPYHYFLQRDRNIQQSFSQQQRQYQGQSSRLGLLERNTVDLTRQNTLLIRQATSPQRRSQASSFMQYSHYYGRNR